MAPSSENGQPRPDEKVLHVWSKPIEQGDQIPGQNPDGSTPQARPNISDAVSQIKKEDFLNVANTPCARQGLLTGIAAGAGLGGLKFVVHGSVSRASNWAVGFFVLGSIASYEYCQYQRRAERIQMKRNIEVVSANRREQAKKLAEEQRAQRQAEEERKTKEKSWYKFW
ncbi:Cytochrome c oxidase protein 20 [Escovopsis weberi]|uniref:Cytochrome c oxidase assembly protein COX20, mitochondrial n=1 Tax=Escovopsis weberi TaxID=150374 RepID=A0A0M8N281_ESCWE|nr:Cytochrome c oxidase protein 20 [Escovopsis weberi]